MRDQYRGSSENLRQLDSGEITLELAQGDPNRWKERLLSSLANTHVHSIKAYNSLVRRGEITLEKIVVNPSTPYCHTETDVKTREVKKIEMGAQPFDPNLKRYVMFEDSRFSGNGEKAYYLSHELSHVFLEDSIDDPGMNTLYNTVIELRRDKELGFSSLGSLDFYRDQGGSSMQALEDMTELVNMYLVDPNYLRRYLEFLAKPDFVPERARLKLLSLDKESKENVFQIVESFVQKEIQR